MALAVIGLSDPEGSAAIVRHDRAVHQAALFGEPLLALEALPIIHIARHAELGNAVHVLGPAEQLILADRRAVALSESPGAFLPVQDVSTGVRIRRVKAHCDFVPSSVLGEVDRRAEVVGGVMLGNAAPDSRSSFLMRSKLGADIAEADLRATVLIEGPEAVLRD